MKKNIMKDDYPLYHNIEGELFYDSDKNEFVMDFDEKQKTVINAAIERRLPIQTVAYPFVSAECMVACMEFARYDQTWHCYNNVYCIDIWKTAMIYKKPEECRMVLAAMREKVNIFKEFKDVRTIAPDVLRLICLAALDGVNICRFVRKGLPYDKLKARAEKMVVRKQKRDAIRSFFSKLRNPEDTYLYY